MFSVLSSLASKALGYKDAVLIGLLLSAALAVYLLFNALQTQIEMTSKWQTSAQQMEDAALNNHKAFVDERRERKDQLKRLARLHERIQYLEREKTAALNELRALEDEYESVRQWASDSLPGPLVDWLQRETAPSPED